MCTCQPALFCETPDLVSLQGSGSADSNSLVHLSTKPFSYHSGYPRNCLNGFLPSLPCPGRMERWDPMGNAILDDSAFTRLRVAKQIPVSCEGDLVLFEACLFILGV